MIDILYINNKISVNLSVIITITAIARLIILQGKVMDPITLIYKASANLIIAVVCSVIRYKSKNNYIYQSEDANASTTLVHNKVSKE